MRHRGALLALIAALAILAAACGGSEAPEGGDAPVGLEAVLAGAHAHSLMVDPDSGGRLWLGVHTGLYRSDDRGRSWRPSGLGSADAMNLAGGRAGPFWVAGHDVLERSSDGGESWESVRPDGLPGLDLHGFTVRAGEPDEVVAAVAGQGLYRSTDGGAAFALLSSEVGGSVFGMSMTEDGTLYAADAGRGLLVGPGGGARFALLIEAPGLVAVAAHPKRPDLVMAGGEPGVVVSTDGGRSWQTRFTEAGVSALAVDPGDPMRAYAVGTDAVLYESADSGRSWRAVGPEPAGT